MNGHKVEQWDIAKEFSFCYGHRVWSQTLIEGYSEDSCLKCRHLHGHQGVIKVFLKSYELEEGMVTDFKHLGWFKKFVDDVLDHKFIMDINDPLFAHEVSQFFDNSPENFILGNMFKHPEGYYTIDANIYEDQPDYIQEKFDGMVFVDFVPTSENISKWLFTIAYEKMAKIGVTVSRVQFFETPKSQSNYGFNY